MENKTPKEGRLKLRFSTSALIRLKRRFSTSALIKIIIVAVALAGSLLIAFTWNKNENEISFRFSAQLVEALDIAELSASEFIYNGIAEVYDEEGKEVLYSIAYNSTVKAGIQMDDISFEVDEAQKTVKPVLPPVSIQSPIVDPASIDYIPSNPNVDLKVSLAACKENTRLEAEQSKKLMQLAEENVKSIVAALLTPILSNAGYRIEW